MRISNIAYALPERKVTNAELAAGHPDWDIARLEPHTGVKSRYWSRYNTDLDLALDACAKLGDLSNVDSLIYVSSTPRTMTPDRGSMLHLWLELKYMPCLDINQACNGYLYGLWLAEALLVSQKAHQVLLINADTYSKYAKDRATQTLFGDGAAATLLERGRPVDVLLGVDGVGSDAFVLNRISDTLHMDGAAVFDFIKREIPPMVKPLLPFADFVIFHQASKLALDYLCKVLEIPPEKTYSNLERVGNTVSASIPICLKDAQDAGVLKPGMRVLLCGFGAGLSWGATVITWMPD